MTHLTCGGPVEPRWVIADDGDHVVVAWCNACDTAPASEELSRRITPEDIPPAVIAQWPGLRKPS